MNDGRISVSDGMTQEQTEDLRKLSIVGDRGFLLITVEPGPDGHTSAEIFTDLEPQEVIAILTDFVELARARGITAG